MKGGNSRLDRTRLFRHKSVIYSYAILLLMLSILFIYLLFDLKSLIGSIITGVLIALLLCMAPLVKLIITIDLDGAGIRLYEHFKHIELAWKGLSAAEFTENGTGRTGTINTTLCFDGKSYQFFLDRNFLDTMIGYCAEQKAAEILHKARKKIWLIGDPN